MRHRQAVAGLAAAYLAAAGYGCTVSATLAPPAPAPTDDGASEGPHVLGMNGCAARGCHGGPTIGPNGQSRAVNSGNAFTHWLLHDRHARAYITAPSCQGTNSLWP